MEIPDTQQQILETGLAAAESEDKQVAIGVTSESKDEVVVQVSGSDETQADSVSEIIVHNEDDGTGSRSQSPSRSPDRIS